ncbi:VacJ family lipoprotein [bacterium]|nr:VacJ family lipoprotein [bacterium]
MVFLSWTLIGCTQQASEPSPSSAGQPETVSRKPPQTQNSINAEGRQLQSDSNGPNTKVAGLNGNKHSASGKKPENDDELDEFEAEFEAAKQEVSDPLEGYNRAMTTFNDRLYLWVLVPVAKGYSAVLPEAPRRGVRHFFHNLLYPLRFVNNLLQFKIKNAGEETLRFVTNTTIGILGFWDPAKEWFGLRPHDEDFGQTLGFYGVGAGPHIVLPFFGPSNLRDTFSMVPDNFLDPVGQAKPIGQTDSYVAEYGVRGFDAVNEASLRPGEYESLKKDAVDFYPFLRDSYEQMRNKQIKE